MFDVWLGDCLLLLAIPAYMLSMVQRLKPRVLPGPGMNLVDLGTLEGEYKRRYPVRLLLLRTLPTVLAIYFGARIMLWPPADNAEGPSLVAMLMAGFGVYVGSVIAANVMRILQERVFIRDHPQFEDSFLPIRPRVLALLPLFASIGLLVAGIVVDDFTMKRTLIALGIIGVFANAKLRMRQMIHSRYELPWDEPHGAKIAEVIERFGFTPKKLVLMPSLMTNAYAMKDGSVVITSALRTLVTPDELAAVIAHEFSHVQDSEGKKLTRLRQISVVPIGALAGFCAAWGRGTSFEPLLPPLIVFGGMAFSIVSLWWLCRQTRPMEFKCDRDAANLGYGSDLASCLEKITRFMGMPPRWIGLDRYLLTHPSLDERLALLREGVE